MRTSVSVIEAPTTIVTCLPRHAAGTVNLWRYSPTLSGAGVFDQSSLYLYVPKPCISQFDGTGMVDHTPAFLPPLTRKSQATVLSLPVPERYCTAVVARPSCARRGAAAATTTAAAGIR
jgi:hypothetical protein